MDISLREVLIAAQGHLDGKFIKKTKINHVSTDSRHIQKGDIFFALKGPRFDGHDFVESVIEKGAEWVVVDEKIFETRSHRVRERLIYVKNTLKAYGDLAHFYRKKFTIPFIALTGSSGKTTLKELLGHILSADFEVLKNQGTENNLIGVPKTLFQLEKKHEVCVLEMGTNQPGEIDRLSAIIDPDIGIITQIGAGHLAGLKNLNGVKKEKLSLLRHIPSHGHLIINAEDKNLRRVKVSRFRTHRVSLSVPGCDFIARKMVYKNGETSFFVGKKDFFSTQLLGEHNVTNILLAIAAAKILGIGEVTLKKRLASFKAVKGRLSSLTRKGRHFLDDSYNANPISFRASLDILKRLKVRGRKILVCGDMLELGLEEMKWHRRIGRTAAGIGLSLIIAVGPLSKVLSKEAVRSGFSSKNIFYADNSLKAGQLCLKWSQPGDTILLKGSRGMAMEKVLECFTAGSTR